MIKFIIPARMPLRVKEERVSLGHVGHMANCYGEEPHPGGSMLPHSPGELEKILGAMEHVWNPAVFCQLSQPHLVPLPSCSLCSLTQPWPMALDFASLSTLKPRHYPLPTVPSTSNVLAPPCPSDLSSNISSSDFYTHHPKKVPLFDVLYCPSSPPLQFPA